MLTNNIINKIIGIIFYSLSLFVSKYLYINRAKLAFKKINTPEKPEKLILSDSTIWSNENIDK